MSEERRRHARVSLGVEVDVSSSSNFFVGQARDLSMGGLFVETAVPVPMGSAVTIDLVLDGKKHVLLAEVVWALDASDGTTLGVGVRLIDLPPRTRSAILAFVGRRAPVEFEMFDPSPEAPCDEVTSVLPSSKEPPPLPGIQPPFARAHPTP